MASYVICNIETCPAHGPPVQMPHKFMLQTRSNNFLSQEPKIYGNFGIHQIEKNVFDMASKSTNVEWTAQCITTPSEYQQTKQTASTKPTTIFPLPIAQPCPPRIMHCISELGGGQSVNCTPTPSDSRPVWCWWV